MNMMFDRQKSKTSSSKDKDRPNKGNNGITSPWPVKSWWHPDSNTKMSKWVTESSSLTMLKVSYTTRRAMQRTICFWKSGTYRLLNKDRSKFPNQSLLKWKYSKRESTLLSSTIGSASSKKTGTSQQRAARSTLVSSITTWGVTHCLSTQTQLWSSVKGSCSTFSLMSDHSTIKISVKTIS